MSEERNALNWFEIPVSDVDRSKKFYDEILGTNLEVQDMMGMQMLYLPASDNKVGGALVKSPTHKPSAEGAVLYLNANPDLNTTLEKVEAAGGKVTMPKTSIGEWGHMAFFTDSEGNNIGLHSNN